MEFESKNREGEEWAEGDKRRKEALVAKEALEGLTKSPGWHILARVIKQQIRMRSNLVVLQPIGSEGGPQTVMAQEYMKGEIQGLRIVLSLPGQIAEDAASVVMSLEDGDA